MVDDPLSDPFGDRIERARQAAYHQFEPDGVDEGAEFESREIDPSGRDLGIDLEFDDDEINALLDDLQPSADDAREPSDFLDTDTDSATTDESDPEPREPFTLEVPDEEAGELTPPSATYGGGSGISCDQRQAECDSAFANLAQNPLSSIDLDIRIKGVAGKDYPCDCRIWEDEVFTERRWAPLTYTWKASGICHKPLYFEEVQLERYGHSRKPLFQAVVSGAHFFATLPALPYKMGMQPPCECVYTLGYYRPGSCAPYLVAPLPWHGRAAFMESAAIIGGVLLIP